MKHGFLILTHFLPEKVFKQVSRLQSPEHYFFIHFDKKVILANDDHFYKQLREWPNVCILEERTDVKWAGFSMLAPIFALMRASLKVADIQYMHLLSTECLHVKPMKYFHQFFEENKGKEFIHCSKVNMNNTIPFTRIDKFHLYDYCNFKSKKIKDRLVIYLNTALRKGQGWLKLLGIYRRYPGSFPVLYWGATWWSLTRQSCAYVIDYIDEHPEFYQRFRHTQGADEMMLQTLIMNSPFSGNVAYENLRFCYFEQGAAHPNPLTMDNRKDLEPANILFARKFTPESRELLAYLDAHVFR